MSDDIEFTATARETDRALARIDGRLDWLSYLTPTALDAGAGGEARFVGDFVAAWTKVMNLDRFDVV